MRHHLVALVIAAALAAPAFAIGDLASFERIQTDCVAAGGVTFGPQGRWADCQVSKARWFSTVGLTDFYQVQYCLGQGGPGCERRALLLFANRAYTPVAKMVLGQIDPGATEYADPLVFDTAYGRILTLESRLAGALPRRSYYLWQDDNWLPIDTDSWRRELGRRLPAGFSLASTDGPDFEAMRAQARLSRLRGGEGSRSVDVELALVQRRLTVKSVKMAPPANDRNSRE